MIHFLRMAAFYAMWHSFSLFVFVPMIWGAYAIGRKRVSLRGIFVLVTIEAASIAWYVWSDSHATQMTGWLLDQPFQ